MRISGKKTFWALAGLALAGLAVIAVMAVAKKLAESDDESDHYSDPRNFGI